MRISFVPAFALLMFAACDSGSGDDVQPIDASGTVDSPGGSIDAPGGTTNALGQTCDAANPACPAGNACITITGIGSSTTGYCSPMCAGDTAICTTGYTGPAGGQPMCALGAQGSPPDACAIVCTASAQCPTGLTCQMANATVMICAAPV